MKKRSVLRYCHQGSSEFNACKKFVEQNVTLESGRAQLDCVEEVTNEALELRFLETRSQLLDPDAATCQKILVVDSEGVEEVGTEYFFTWMNY